jgi:hypothetical protein
MLINYISFLILYYLYSNSILTYSDIIMKENSQMTILQNSQRTKLDAKSSEKKVSDENREMKNTDKDEIDRN